jgi:hypothetical protein
MHVMEDTDRTRVKRWHLRHLWADNAHYVRSTSPVLLFYRRKTYTSQQRSCSSWQWNGHAASPRFCRYKNQRKQTPQPESANDLYLPSDRLLSAKLVSTFADREVSRGQHNDSLWPYSRLSRLEQLFFLSSNSSIVLTRLSGPRSRPTTSQKIC